VARRSRPNGDHCAAKAGRRNEADAGVADEGCSGRADASESTCNYESVGDVGGRCDGLRQRVSSSHSGQGGVCECLLATSASGNRIWVPRGRRNDGGISFPPISESVLFAASHGRHGPLSCGPVSGLRLGPGGGIRPRVHGAIE
jgi:hypothetical protein